MKYLLAFLLFSFLASTASAQFTITEQDYLSVLGSANKGKSFYSQDVSGLQTLVNTSGASQTWDFGTRVWTENADSESSTLLADPSSAPLSSNFPGATHVLKLTPSAGTFDQATLYDFLEVNASGVWNLGFSQDSLGKQSILETYTPPEQLLAFPLTYGTTWSSSSSINSPAIPAGLGIVDSSRLTTTIDGYGTLITPAAPSGVVTLREKQETIAKESYPPYFSTETRAYGFTWITQGFDQAAITADSNQKPTEATYSVASGSGVRASNEDPFSMYLSQNPASNVETKLYYTLQSAAPVQLELMDALGKNVQLLQNGIGHAGENIIPIDPTKLPAGTYFIHLQTSGTNALQKLVIQ